MPVPVSMMVKRQELIDQLVDQLALHDLPEGSTGLKSADRYRRETEPKFTRAERIRVMGDPCYYLEVIEAGPTLTTGRDQGTLNYMSAGHTFRVSFWLQYKDNDVQVDASQAEFDQMVEGFNPDGILVHLRTLGQDFVRTPDDTPLDFHHPVDDRKDVLPLDGQAKEAAHHLTFEITIQEVI